MWILKCVLGENTTGAKHIVGHTSKLSVTIQKFISNIYITYLRSKIISKIIKQSIDVI